MKVPFRVLNYEIFRILLIFNKFTPVPLEANYPLTHRNRLGSLTSQFRCYVRILLPACLTRQVTLLAITCYKLPFFSMTDSAAHFARPQPDKQRDFVVGTLLGLRQPGFVGTDLLQFVYQQAAGRQPIDVMTQRSMKADAHP